MFTHRCSRVSACRVLPAVILYTVILSLYTPSIATLVLLHLASNKPYVCRKPLQTLSDLWHSLHLFDLCCTFCTLHPNASIFSSAWLCQQSYCRGARVRPLTQVSQKASYSPHLQATFFSNFSLFTFFLFSLTWDPMGTKILKRYFSHSFDPISTKLYDKMW